MSYDLLLRENTSNEIINRYYLKNEEETINHLPNVNKINIFVGANNSGKSWMMRYLMNLKDFKYFDNESIKNKLEYFNNHQYVNKTINLKAGNLSSNLKFPLKIISNFEDFTYYNIKKKSTENFESLNNLLIYPHWNRFDTNINSNEIQDLHKRCLEIKNILNNIIEIKEPNKIYIPTLRTSHSLFHEKNGNTSKIEDDIFTYTLKTNYEIGNAEIFSGLHLHKDILNARNSKKDKRKKFDDFEKFIQKNCYNGKEVDIVAEFDKDKSLQGDNSSEIISIHIEGEKDTRYLYELGDGIQALIILIFKIFMAENNSFIFIDEPELNLHPGMQRLFFEQITLNKDITDKNLTFFITTHSNHLLDLTLQSNDVSIYSFSPEIDFEGNKKFIIKNVNSGNNELLRQLGVNNTSVFLANSSIWVEGISDRNYIKAFLIAYCNQNLDKYKYPKEDIDFVFFEYAGGNIEHYLFDEQINDEAEERFLQEINTLAISNRIFLFADSDMSDEKPESKKYKRLKKLEEKFGSDNLNGRIIWGFRESENLLSKEVWKKILIDFCVKNKINASTQELINQKISNIGNWDSYKTEYVGKFLKKLKDDGVPLREICDKKNVGRGEQWQTFKEKADLSRFILEKTLNKEITWDDFKQIPEVELLTEQIYTFITQKEKIKQENE